MPYLEPDPVLDPPTGGPDRRDGIGKLPGGRRPAREGPSPRRGPTLVESGVVVAILGVLAALLMPSNGEYHWMTERRLARWTPGPGDELPPMAAIRDRDAPIAGTWTCRWHRSGSSLTITPDAAKTYSVRFSSSACTRQITLDRSATFRDGVLTLDLAVEEVSPRAISRKFFAIRVGGAAYLVPAARVARLMEGISADGTPAEDARRFKRDFYEPRGRAVSRGRPDSRARLRIPGPQ